MRTKTFFWPATLVMGLFAFQNGHAQVSWPDNVPNAPGTDYVGWDNSTTVPLEIRHNANQPIDFYTRAIHRMRLNPNAGYHIGSVLFGTQNANGFLGISPNNSLWNPVNSPGPFTRLHLHDGSSFVQQSGYRPQMRNGITLTGNSDQMYVGQLYHGVDYTDAAIVWSDNAGGWLADRLTFNFTSSYNPSATAGNNSMRGLQTFLIQPAASGDEAFVGIGDFDAASETPAERLDVLNGRVRIRQLPTSPAAGTLTRYMVVDDDGVVHWRALPPAVAGCEWDQFGAANHLRTAWSGAALGCPDENSHVGIGTTALPGKLSIEKTANVSSAAEHAVHVTMRADNESNYGLTLRLDNQPGHAASLSRGIDVLTHNAAGTTTGTRSRAYMAEGQTATGQAMGVEAISSIYGQVQNAMGTVSTVDIHSPGQVLGNAYGVQAIVRNYSGDPASVDHLYGVYGLVTGTFGQEQRAIYGRTNSAPNCWAGYFVGNARITQDLHVNGNWLSTSDATLKTDV